MILADTDVLIDYLGARKPALDIVSRYLQSDELQTSAINCFELLSGAREGARGDRVRAFVADLDVLPLDRKAAEWAARVRQELEREGNSIGMGIA